eukprot:TRINITY_DN14265_c0_g1_i13.p2 TRINITY_DN14265_c0_g1~~TRINITY_DN14265_c0_g1_i13.p2  ORF type:complete len:118 (-),score=40.63 TRINITY_DN14265_c0_g1_i13:31-384(-)
MRKLDEERMVVQCLQRDQQVVTAAASAAKKRFEAERAGKSVTLALDHDFLPVDEELDVPCLGGIALWSEDRHICCRNTLNVRLKFAAECKMPELKVLLFGREGAAPAADHNVMDLLH